jgi:SOS response regulatory protein OraA/RecX
MIAIALQSRGIDSQFIAAVRRKPDETAASEFIIESIERKLQRRKQIS